MSDDSTQPPYIYEGLDPGREVDPFGTKKLSAAIESLRTLVDGAKKPGMPLSVLSNIAREAPLGSLFVAFMLGVAIGRRG